MVVATGHLAGSVAARSREMTQAFENYNQLRVFSRPLTGVYLLFFLMVTLMILVGASWMGLYLAKRITRPVQLLAHAAREIGAGHLDQRVEPQSDDEFGSLTEAFNTMASELAASRLKVEQTTQALEQRRRYVETILERITTGVISINPAGVVTTINSAAARLLGIPRTVIGQDASTILAGPDLEPLSSLLKPTGGTRTAGVEREVTIVRDGHESHLTVVATPLTGDSGVSEGRILVFDDVTPLIRAQKVAAWREVARRLAHEIKNPLTPIQLSAERLKRHFGDAPSGARALVEECTGTIIGEVESLKGLVDEFSQFARMPTPRTAPTDLHALIDGTLSLYDGIFSDVTFVRHVR
ncbi:MAG: HAMP domain-containing protein [Vicinamibacterales bacterium]